MACPRLVLTFDNPSPRQPSSQLPQRCANTHAPPHSSAAHGAPPETRSGCRDVHATTDAVSRTSREACAPLVWGWDTKIVLFWTFIGPWTSNVRPSTSAWPRALMSRSKMVGLGMFVRVSLRTKRRSSVAIKTSWPGSSAEEIDTTSLGGCGSGQWTWRRDGDGSRQFRGSYVVEISYRLCNI